MTMISFLLLVAYSGKVKDSEVMLQSIMHIISNICNKRIMIYEND